MIFGALDTVQSDESPEEKRRMREKIARDVDRFLADGGEIEDCGGPIESPDYARPVYIHKEGNA